MRLRRGLWLCWLALALNALAPIVAYAHIQHEIGGSDAGCPADPAPDARIHDHHGGDGDDRAGPASKRVRTPHCPYCPGFSAGAPLAAGAPDAVAPVRALVEFIPAHLRAPAARASVRIAQPRAPPFPS